MPDLPDVWHEIDGPAREPLDFWTSGDGGDRWDTFQLQDENGAPVDCSGLTIEADIRDDNDQQVAALAAEWTDAAIGSARVKTTAAVAAAMGCTAIAMPRGGRQRLGVYAVFITDTAGRWCIKSGDAFGVRK